jgi:leucyl-tRNA---protein transferase
MNHTDAILEYYLPQQLSKKRLDRYLAAGWFRTVNMLFRSKVTCFDNDICSPINIRIKLPTHVFSKSQQRLLNRNGRLFRYEIKKASITTEKEEMFRLHQRRFRSFLCNSLEEFLVLTHRFDTYEIAIYDDERLVAVSFFDEGHLSLMSLLGLFDPSYAKYSLGIYTMLLEMQYAQQTQRQWYYPGYVHERPSIYDYKLRLGKVEVYDWEARVWLKDRQPSDIANWANWLRKYTNELEKSLQEIGIICQQKIYLFFGWHYFNPMYDHLLRCPLILLLPDGRVVAYDADLRQYVCVRLEIYVPFRDIQMTLAPDFDPNCHYIDVMKVAELQYQSRELTDMVNFIWQTTLKPPVTNLTWSITPPF